MDPTIPLKCYGFLVRAPERENSTDFLRAVFAKSRALTDLAYNGTARAATILRRYLPEVETSWPAQSRYRTSTVRHHDSIICKAFAHSIRSPGTTGANFERVIWIHGPTWNQ